MAQEKSTLLPTVVDSQTGAYQTRQLGAPTIILYPGLEFDPRRKHSYGYSSLFAAMLIFVSWLVVESRTCYWGPGLDFDRLQALHIALMIFAFVLFLLSLFGFADFIFQFKLFFFFGVIVVYVAAGLQIWSVYQAAVSPCKPFPIPNAPLDLHPKTNVFNAGDGWGIVVLLMDTFAAILFVSAASSFYKRY